VNVGREKTDGKPKREEKRDRRHCGTSEVVTGGMWSDVTVLGETEIGMGKREGKLGQVNDQARFRIRGCVKG